MHHIYELNRRVVIELLPNNQAYTREMMIMESIVGHAKGALVLVPDGKRKLLAGDWYVACDAITGELKRQNIIYKNDRDRPDSVERYCAVELNDAVVLRGLKGKKCWTLIETDDCREVTHWSVGECGGPVRLLTSEHTSMLRCPSDYNRCKPWFFAMEIETPHLSEAEKVLQLEEACWAAFAANYRRDTGSILTKDSVHHRIWRDGYCRGLSGSAPEASGK